jgi:hypothetical protein
LIRSDAVRAGLAAAVLGGLRSSYAAGSLLVPDERRPGLVLAAAVPVHLTLSVGWALVLSAVLPRRPGLATGAAAGLAIAALDLGVVGRRFERVRRLPVLPQLADHVAYGIVVAAVLRRARAT